MHVWCSWCLFSYDTCILPYVVDGQVLSNSACHKDYCLHAYDDTYIMGLSPTCIHVIMPLCLIGACQYHHSTAHIISNSDDITYYILDCMRKDITCIQYQKRTACIQYYQHEEISLYMHEVQMHVVDGDSQASKVKVCMYQWYELDHG
jgi:hypothetical protein